MPNILANVISISISKSTVHKKANVSKTCSVEDSGNRDTVTETNPEKSLYVVIM